MQSPRKHCRGCGRFLLAGLQWRLVEWCSGVCLERFIGRYNLRQLDMFKRLGRPG